MGFNFNRLISDIENTFVTNPKTGYEDENLEKRIVMLEKKMEILIDEVSLLEEKHETNVRRIRKLFNQINE